MTIVSLIPAATEIVAALGLSDRLVGLSHECDYPPDLPELPRLTAPKLDPQAASGEIDRSVRGLVEAALSVYDIDAERLRALAPDIILTQDQCEVCAVSRSALESALADWTGLQPQLVSLAPARLGDILDDIQHVAALTGVPDLGVQVVLEAKRRIDAVKTTAGEAERQPRLAFLEWIDPLMGPGLWAPELVEAAGAVPLFGEAGAHTRILDPEALAAADPEIVVAAPCGFDRARTEAEMNAAAGGDSVFKRLTAAREGRVALCDGSAYFNRSGPRIVDSLEILAEIVHPELFPPRHAGTAYRWWSPGS